MRRLLFISLVALYAMTLSQAYMPHVNYWVNRDYIIAELCENKDKPELECNGKCHLKKEIQEGSEDKNGEQEVANSMMLEFFQHLEDYTLVTGEDVCSLHFCDYADPIVAGFTGSLFRPPKV